MKDKLFLIYGEESFLINKKINELVDKENLRPLEMVISKIFKNNYEIKYKTAPNHRVYLTVTLNRKITSTERGLLKAKIPMSKYHYTLEINKEKVTIEIHNKGILEK